MDQIDAIEETITAPSAPSAEPEARTPRVRLVKPTIAPPLAETYADLVRMLIARRRNLGLSLLELDHRAGFADGHASKLEAPDRAYGRMPAGNSLEYWLGALDVAIGLIPLNRRRFRPTLANPLQLDLFDPANQPKTRTYPQ